VEGKNKFPFPKPSLGKKEAEGEREGEEKRRGREAGRR